MSRPDDAARDVGNPAREVRDEDAFDVGAVAAWLRRHAAPEFATVVSGEPEVRQFPGGASNLTYLLRYPAARPDPAASAGRHQGQERPRHAPRVRHPGGARAPSSRSSPPMVAFCDDAAVLGSDFYVMERLEGVIPRRDLPVRPHAGADRDACATTPYDVLVRLHSVDVEAAGLADLGHGEGYVARQVAGLDRPLRPRSHR